MKKLIASLSLAALLMVNLHSGGVLHLLTVETAHAADPVNLSVSVNGTQNATAGNTVSYTYGVMQNDSGVATGVQLTHPVPSGFTFDSASGATCSEAGGTVTCTGFTDIPQNQTRPVTLTYQSDESQCGTSVTVSGATASASETDTNPGNDTSNSVTTSFDACSADLAVALSVSDTIVNPNGSITYTAVATNNGPNTVSLPTVTIPTPSGLTFRSAGSTGGCNDTGSSVECRTQGLSSGDSTTFTVIFDVDAGAACGGSFDPHASISSSVSDPSSSNDSVTLSSVAIECTDVDVSITKSGPATAEPLNTLTYDFVVSNAGPSTARDVVLTDTVGSGLSFDSSTGTCTDNGGTVNCTIGDLSSGASENISITYSVPVSAVCGSTVNESVSVATSSDDTNSSNNTASAQDVTIDCSNNTADLRLTKTGPAQVAPTGALTYSFTIANAGPFTAENVSLTDPIPSGLSLQSASSGCSENAGNIECDGFSVASGQSEILTITYSIGQSVSCGTTIAETATVTSTTTDPNTNDNASSAQNVTVDCSNQPANLSITKSSPSGTFERNGTVTYQVEVENIGFGDANQVTVTDLIPTGLDIDIANSDSRCTDNGANVLCDAGTLSQGQATTFTIAFTVEPSATCGGSISNTANVSTSSTDSDSSNNSATSTAFTVDCSGQQVDVSLQFVTSPSGGFARDDLVTYVLQAVNVGPGTADNITVSMPIPAGTTLEAASSDIRCIPSGSNVLCNDIALNSAATTDFTVVYRINNNATCGAVVDASATISTSSTDTNSANNGDSVSGFTVDCTGSETDLSLFYIAEPTGTVARDEAVTYTFTVANAGPGTASTVTASMDVPSGMDFVPGQSDSRCIDSSGTVLCTTPSLATGNQTAFSLVFRVQNAATCNASIFGSATVSASMTDPNSGNNTDNTGAVTVDCTGSEADLSIATATTVSTVQRGGTYTYEFSVTNHGPGTAHGVTIANPLPNSVVYSAPTSSQNCVEGNGEVLCNNFSLQSGETSTVQISYTVDQAATCGSTISALGSVSTSTTDPNSTNNAISAPDITVSCTPQSADLVVAMMGPHPNFVTPGNTLVYMVQVFNAGPDPAVNFTVDIPAPQGTSFNADPQFTDGPCIANGSDARCVKPDGLAVGQLYSFHVGFSVNTSPCFETISSNATVTSTTPDANASNNVTGPVQTIVQCPQSILEIEKAGPLTAHPGEIIDYHVTLRNVSQAETAQQATIIDLLPPEVEFVQQGSSPDCHPGIDDSAWCDPQDLAPGAVRTVTIRVRIKDTVQCNDQIGNVADVWAENTDPNWSNQVITTVVCSPASFTIAKDDYQSVVAPNGTLTYDITVQNISGVVAQNVVITDALPPHVSFVSASDGGFISGGNVLWTGLNFAPGQTMQLSLTVLVHSNAPDGVELINTAHVSGGPSASDTTRVSVPVASVSMAKTDHRTIAEPGERLTYHIAVSNSTQVVANGFTIIDTLPTGVTFSFASDGGTHSNGVVTWANQSVPAGQTRVYTVDVSIDPSVAHDTVLTNTARIPEYSAQATDVTTVRIPQPVGCIDVFKEAFDTVGNSITPVPQFTFSTDNGLIQGVNSGNGHVRLTDVPVGTQFVQEIVPPTWSLTQVSPALGEVTVVENGPCATVHFTNVQHIHQPILHLEKTDGLTFVHQGQESGYFIDIFNDSPNIATGVTVIDVLPPHLTFVDASHGGQLQGGTVEWTDLTIEPWSFLSLELGVLIDVNAPDGFEIVNEVRIPDYNLVAQDSTIVDAVSLGCIDVVKEVFTGSGVLFFPVPHGFSFRLDGGQHTVTPDANGRARFTNVPVGSRIVTESYPSSWRQISVTPPGGQVHVPAGPNCATVLFKNQMVTEVPAFTIEKTDGVAAATPTQSLTYTITIANTSGVYAEDVLIEDVLPGGVTFQSANPNAVLSGSLLQFDPIDIAAHQVVTLTVIANIDSTTPVGTVLTNTARIVGGPAATDVTTVSGTPILTIAKSDNTTTTSPGSRLTYSVVVSNASPTIAANAVTLIDTLPAQLTFVSASDGGVFNATARTITWSNVTVAANSNTVRTLVADVSTTAANGTVLTNTVQIAGGNSAQDSTTVQVNAVDPNNVTIDLTDDRDPVRPSDSFCYRVTVTNLNTAELTNQTITQTLDGKTTFTSASDSGTHNASVITWSNVTLPASGTKVLTSCVQVAGNARNNDILNSQAFINAKSDSESTRVTDNFGGSTGGGGGVSDECRIVSITDSPDPVDRGETLSYNIRIRNETNRNRDVHLTAFFDNDVSFLSASRGGDDNGREVEWDRIALDADETETVRLTVRVLQTAGNGETLRLRVRCEDDEESESTRVFGREDEPEDPRPEPENPVRLSVDKRANRQEAQPGDSVIYNITVRNLTNRPAHDVRIEDRFSAGSIAIEDAGGGRVIGNGIDWSIPTLGANDTRVFSYRTRVGRDMRHGQVIRNTVRVVSRESDRPATDVEDVRIITALPQTGLGGFINSKTTGVVTASSVASDTGALAAFILWTSIVSIGLTAGSVFGRRVFL